MSTEPAISHNKQAELNPPPDWDVTASLSHDVSSSAEQSSVAEHGSPSAPDPRAASKQQLRELDEKYEFATIEMNTLDGMRRLDDLAEEREYLLEELAALDPAPDHSEPIPTLVDARFVNQTERDEAGQVTRYAVQAVQLYEDRNQHVTGQILEVGQYDSEETAAESYTALQESVDSGAITLAQVGLLAEAMAEENGLDAHAWREMSAWDFVNYRDHATELGATTRDPTHDTFHTDDNFATPLFHTITPDADEAALADEPILAALHEIGLEMPENYKPSRDSFYDSELGERVINGVFQADRDDPTQNCRPLFVTFTAGDDDHTLQAQAVEFGMVGSLEDANVEHEQVQQALEDGGIHAALDAMVEIETVHLEPAPEPTSVPAWSRDID